MIDLQGIKRYSESFATRMVAEVKEVNGEQLLKLCPVEQVNLLMAKNLYLNWEEELENLKSPHFNYQAEEVRSALNNLMNILSKNILIDKEHLKPLVAQAVSQLLILAADPRIYFLEHFLPPDKESIERIYLEKVQKFIKINHQVLTKLLDKIQESEKEKITRTDYEDRIKIVIAELKDSFDPLASICQQLSLFAPIEETQILITKKEAASAMQQDDEKAREEAEEISINERFNRDKTPLNQRLMSEPKKTLAELHRDQKVDNLKESLTLNQQFMFIKELFSGDELKFTQALEKLESCNTYDEAHNLLERSYAHDNQWEMDSEPVSKFLEILSRRF